MENNNSFTAIIVIIAILVLIAFYVITNSDGLKIQTPGLRKAFGLRNISKKSTRKGSSSANPATVLESGWYIQIGDVNDGTEWEEPYFISMPANQEEYRIGRNPECDLCLPDTRVSWEHGAIYLDDDDEYCYRHAGNHGKTYDLSTRKPIEEIKLKENLDLLIGIYQLRFHYQSLEPVLPPVNIEEKPEKKKEPEPSQPIHKGNKKDKPLNVMKVGKMSDKDEKTKIFDQ